QPQDLLDPCNRSNLTIRERPSGEIYVEGLSQTPAPDAPTAMALLLQGEANRATASTALNSTSSRSHTAAIVRVEQRRGQG
ncbi:unnamed protein product, partial [Discosporangium mesarthrocarpum]